MIVPPSRSIQPVAVHDVAAHYDELDPFYRDVWGEHVHHGLWETGTERPDEAVRTLVRRVAAQCAIVRGHRVVDIGAGYGATARLLAREIGVRVTGLTVSRAQYEHALRASDGNGQGEVTILHRDWLSNGLADTSADAAIAIESTEHMADLGSALAEARRVLRPGGRLVVCAWVAGDAPTPWQRRHLLEPICVEGRLAALTTEAEHRALLAVAGLELIAADDLTERVARTWSICLRRVALRVATRPRWLRYAFDRRNRQRVFLLTMLRIREAYRRGAMRYVMFTAQKPGAGD